jgi:MSHA biogenesis protein MshQ
VSALTCTLPGACVNGTLTPGTYTGAGARVSNGASYGEAGAFDLTLVDQDYASVDASDGTPADCSASGRYVCQVSAPLAVGRFVPDRFEFAAPSTPVLLSFNTAACSPRSFTYIGQPFWYATLPSATLNAVNAAGSTTTNYPVSGSKPSLSESYADGTAPAAAPLNSSAIGTAVLTAGSGTGTYSASVSAGAQLSYDRSPATLVAPFNAAISLTVSASDATENSVTGNGIIGTTSPLVFNGGGGGIAFDSGAQFRYGRLQIGDASGSQLLPLSMPMETQYWNGSVFTTNTADNCTTLAAGNVGLGNYAGNLNAGETAATLSGAFAAGKHTLSLSAPGAGNNGSVDLVVNLGATFDSCTTFAAPPPTPAGANQPWLRGRWCGATQTRDTTGRATFGVYLGAEETIYVRENF